MYQFMLFGVKPFETNHNGLKEYDLLETLTV